MTSGCTTNAAKAAQEFLPLWNVPARIDQNAPGEADDSFVRTAAGRCRKLARNIGDVGPDYGEITVFQFPDVRAAVERLGFCPVRVRVGANATKESNHGSA